MGTVENYTEAMTGTLSKRALRRQVDRIGFDAAARQYEKWMEEAEYPRSHADRLSAMSTTKKRQTIRRSHRRLANAKLRSQR